MFRAIVSKRGDEKITTIMTKKPIVADEDITAEKALEIMYTNKVERLPVINGNGKLIGIITMQDLLEKRQYPFASRDRTGNLRVAAAVGPFDFARVELLDQNGVDALVVDCAHGHNMKVVAAVQEIKGSVKAEVIAGNIATKEAAEALLSAGVDGIKVGIGPGSICTTRIVAGTGVPQITAVAQVADVAHGADVPVISDGGVRFSGDVAKAIAAGADSVMMGSMFAGTDESPGKVITMKGRRYKQYPRHGVPGCHEYGTVERPVLPEEGHREHEVCTRRCGGCHSLCRPRGRSYLPVCRRAQVSHGIHGFKNHPGDAHQGKVCPDHQRRHDREPPAQHHDHGRSAELPALRIIRPLLSQSLFIPTVQSFCGYFHLTAWKSRWPG